MYSDIEIFLRGSADQELERRISKPVSIRHQNIALDSDEKQNSFEDIELSQPNFSISQQEVSKRKIESSLAQQDASNNATIYNCLLTLIVFTSSLPMVNMQILFLRTSQYVNEYSSLQYALLVAIFEISWALFSAIGWISLKAIRPLIVTASMTSISSRAASQTPRSIIMASVVTILSCGLYISSLPSAASVKQDHRSWFFYSAPFSLLVLSRALLGISAAIAQYSSYSYVRYVHQIISGQFNKSSGFGLDRNVSKDLVNKISLFRTSTSSYLPIIAGTVLLWTKPPMAPEMNLTHLIFNFFTAQMWLAISTLILYGLLFLIYYKRIEISPSAISNTRLADSSPFASDNHRRKPYELPVSLPAATDSFHHRQPMSIGSFHNDNVDITHIDQVIDGSCSNCGSDSFHTAWSESSDKRELKCRQCEFNGTSKMKTSSKSESEFEDFKVDLSPNFNDNTEDIYTKEYLQPSFRFATMHSLQFLDLQNFGSSDSSSSHSRNDNNSDCDFDHLDKSNPVKIFQYTTSRQERAIQLIADRWSGRSENEPGFLSPECGSATSNELFSYSKEQMFHAYLTKIGLVLNLIDFLVHAAVWGLLWNLFAVAYAYGIITSNIDQTWRVFICAAVGGGIGMSLRLESVIACCGRYRCSVVYNEHVACIIIGLVLVLISFGLLLLVQETADRVSSGDMYNRYVAYCTSLLLLALGHSWYTHSSETLYRVILGDLAALGPLLRVMKEGDGLSTSPSSGAAAQAPQLKNCPPICEQDANGSLKYNCDVTSDHDQRLFQYNMELRSIVSHWCYGRVFISMVGRITGILFSASTLKFGAPAVDNGRNDGYAICRIPWISVSMDYDKIIGTSDISVCVVLNFFGWGLVSFLLILCSCLLSSLLLYFHYKLSRRAEVAPPALRRPNSSSESVY